MRKIIERIKTNNPNINICFLEFFLKIYKNTIPIRNPIIPILDFVKYNEITEIDIKKLYIDFFQKEEESLKQARDIKKQT
jgi:hypothetical protein